MVVVRRAWFLLCAAAASAVFSGTARAQSKPPVQFGLEYQATGLACPSASEFRQALAERLEYDPFAAEATATDYRVRIVMTRAGEAIVAHMDWVDRDGHSEGERRLTSERGDCAELARGVVFAVAVQIQLRAAGNPETASVEPEPPPPAAPKPAPPVPEAAKPRPPAPQRAEQFVLVGFGPTFVRGWLPNTGVGVQVLGMAARDWASLELGVDVILPNDQRQRDGTAFEARIFSGFIAPCVRFRPFGVCALAAVGRLAVEGKGVDRPLTPSSTLAGVGTRLELLLPLASSIGLLAHGSVLASLTRREVELNRVPVWSTAPIVFGGGIDAALIFR